MRTAATLRIYWSEKLSTYGGRKNPAGEPTTGVNPVQTFELIHLCSLVAVPYHPIVY